MYFIHTFSNMKLAIVFWFYAVVALSFAQPGDIKNLNNRIFGGKQEGVIPYQVSISNNDLPICSGSIIDPRWVLTAAHCLYLLDKYPGTVSIKIRAGSANQFAGGVVIPASNFYVHRFFDKDTFDSDIALIKLSEALVLNDTIQLISLPNKTDSVPVGVPARIAGWGRSETQLYNILLRSTEVYMISQKSCEKLYQKHFTERMICAGSLGGDEGFSVGDGGGALAINNVQYGIISHKFTDDEFTGIYTNVVKFLDFILDTVKGRA